MAKKFTDSRLREIALMTSKGMSAELIAEVIGLTPKSVSNICCIYRWSPDYLDEMTERCKLRGPRGDDARCRVRRYFVMHPEQRPAPQLELFRKDKPKADDEKEPVSQKWQTDLLLDSLEDARANHDERLSTHKRRLDGMQSWIEDADKRFGYMADHLTSLAQRAEELDRSIGATHNLVCTLKQARGPEALPVTLDRLAACEKQIGCLTRKIDDIQTDQYRPVLAVDKRLAAMTRQIERLQDVLVSLAEALPKEYA